MARADKLRLGLDDENDNLLVLEKNRSDCSVVSHFEFRFIGKGPNISLKNKTNSAIVIIAIHHGLSTIGNKTTSNHAHQGIRDHRSLPNFVGFA